MTNPYDPFRHAEEIGMPVQWVALPGNLHGLWTGESILLDPRLNQTQARCTLAHEIVHAEQDAPMLHAHYAARIEARADKIAAHRLIDAAEYRKIARAYPYANQIAQELGVTTKILKAYTPER